MKCASLVAAAVLTLTARAAAADSVVELTLEGRPVDRHSGVAILHHGVIFADAIALTKCFDGLITLVRSGAATITIGPNTGTFVPGSTFARVNNKVVALPDAPFQRNGELFVPLEAFSTAIADVNVNVDRTRHRADIRIKMRVRSAGGQGRRAVSGITPKPN